MTDRNEGDAMTSGTSSIASPTRARLLRFAIAALTAAAATGVIWWRGTYRQFETLAAGKLTHLVVSGHALINRHTSTFFLNTGTAKVFGVVVTPECSSAIVTGLVLAVTAVAIATTRFTLRRALMAALGAAGLFAGLNLLRLVMIAFATDHWGLGPGYRWSHVWAGTFITVFGGAAAAALYLMILSGRPTLARLSLRRHD
jgi:exosortase/archaeosortase family protein